MMNTLMLTAGEGVEVTTRGLSDLLTDAGEVVEAVVSWIPSVAQLVVNEPILLVGFTIGLATLAFGIFKGLKQ